MLESQHADKLTYDNAIYDKFNMCCLKTSLILHPKTSNLIEQWS